MPTTTLRTGNAVATHTVTAEFTNVTTSIAAAANVIGLLRNLQNDKLIVIKGGSVAPNAGSSGEVLEGHSAVYCNTDYIWVRAADGAGLVCFETL
jgi:hypothetical protein